MNTREDLKAYLDDELETVRREEVRQALERDPALREELESLRLLGEAIAAAAPMPLASGLEDTLRRLESLPGPRRRLRWLPLATAGGALLVLGMLIGPLVQDGGRQEGVSEPAASMAYAVPEMADEMTTRSAAGQMELKAAPMAAGAALPASDAANVSSGLVIRTSNLQVEVADLAAARSEASSLAQAMGGFVESSRSEQYAGARPSAGLVLRVPESAFTAALERLRSLGEVQFEQIGGQDVTEQVVDMEARLKVLRAEEDQYVTLLGKATKIGEVLQIRERLTMVRQEIESIDAQRKSLRQRAAMSTIDVTLHQKAKVGEPKPVGSWYEKVWASAVNGLLALGRGLGAALIVIFVFAPIWLPVALLTFWLVRRRR